MGPKLTDPVEKPTEEKKEAEENELKKVFDISNIKISELKSAQLKDAQSRHPFDGYPEKKVQVGTYMEKGKEKPLIVNLTHIIVYREEVKQDPSGQRVSLGFPEMRSSDGKIIRPNTAKTGVIKTAHNQRRRDYESGGVDFDAVFDRSLKLADGETDQACFIPSPSVRAQIVFRYNAKTEKIENDSRYLLADSDQVGRLRRLFEMIINPRIRAEEAMRRTFDEGGDAFQSSTLPGIPEGE